MREEKDPSLYVPRSKHTVQQKNQTSTINRKNQPCCRYSKLYIKDYLMTVVSVRKSRFWLVLIATFLLLKELPLGVSFSPSFPVRPFRGTTFSKNHGKSSRSCLPAKRRGRRSKTATRKPESSTKYEEESPTSKIPAANGLVRNLFSVCAHLQNPELHVPQWADHATLVTNISGAQKPTLVTSCRLKIGEIVSLHPIDALGLRTPLPSSERRPAEKRKTPQPPAAANAVKARDFFVSDVNKDGDYFAQTLARSLSQSAPLLGREYRIPTIPLSFLQDGELQERQLFSDVVVHPTTTNDNNDTNNINDNSVQPAQGPRWVPGWMGHMATKLNKDDTESANCMIVPLPGASPLCALVAIQAMKPEEELLVAAANIDADRVIVDALSACLTVTYSAEIDELRAYLNMAYQPPLQPLTAATTSTSQNTGGLSKTEENVGTKDPTVSFESPFHGINMDYPGLKYLHRDPDILVIENFLSDDECDRITTNAKSHMIPCVIKHPITGAVQEDPSRTSTNANMPQSDVPSIVDKMVQLTNCQDASHLETLQILRYTEGQTFYPHTDGFEGPTTACGFEASGRLVTIFCYLNDVAEGGETRFTNLAGNDDENQQVLSIAPRKGTAVLHFPATTGLEEDPRTEHEGCPAVDEKWLLVTWAWKDARVDPAYAEGLFPTILGNRQ